MTDSAASFDIGVSQGVLQLKPRGDWRARYLGGLDGALRDFADDSVGRDLVIDMSGVEKLDTVGAMMLQRTMHCCAMRSKASRFVNAAEVQAALLAQVETHLAPCHVEPTQGNAFVAVVRRLGEGVVDSYYAAIEILSFIGLALTTAARVAVNPKKMRWTSTVYHMEEAGLNALPIVSLMSFLIGAQRFSDCSTPIFSRSSWSAFRSCVNSAFC